MFALLSNNCFCFQFCFTFSKTDGEILSEKENIILIKINLIVFVNDLFCYYLIRIFLKYNAIFFKEKLFFVLIKLFSGCLKKNVFYRREYFS